MKIGIFGGSFDPVHTGHLIIAEMIRTAVPLDTVWFVPAPQPPHKTGLPITDFTFRAEMLEAAVAGHPAFSVSRIEAELPLPSYTIQTLRHLSKQYPEHQRYLIIGSDMAQYFSLWCEPEAILDLCTPVVYPRAGSDIRMANPAYIKKMICPALPLIEISSTMIRERIRKEQSVRYLVPDAVLEYIIRHRLYFSDNPSDSCSD